MDPVHDLDRAHDLVHHLIANLPAGGLGTATPCAEYDLRGLLNHVIGGAWMFSMCAAGQPLPEDDSTDVVGDDPLASWDAASAASAAAWRGAGVLDGPVTLPFATLPGQVAMNVAFAETVIHAWDIAKASGQSTRLPDDLATSALAIAEQIITDDFRGPETFGPALAAPEGATAADRLAAFCGRAI